MNAGRTFLVAKIAGEGEPIVMISGYRALVRYMVGEKAPDLELKQQYLLYELNVETQRIRHCELLDPTPVKAVNFNTGKWMPWLR